MGLAYPQLNNIYPDWAKISLAFTGTNIPIINPLIAFEALSFKIDSNGELVHGAAEIGIGQTTGQFTPTASCTMYAAAYQQLIASISSDTLGDGVLSGGYMTQLFNMMITYDLGDGVLTYDMLFGCRIKSDNGDFRKGGTPLSITFDLQPIYGARNSVLPNDDILNVQAAASALLALL